MSVTTGLEVFLAGELPELSGSCVGLITNPTGIDRQLRSTIDVLHASKRVELVALFGPEHGVRGAAQAGVKVRGGTDERTGLPVHSLYGETYAPTADMLVGLDALIFDIQDIGVRYATYLSTMMYAQEAAAGMGVQFVVFDRPTPINGFDMQGNVLSPGFESFVGIYPIPIRHGMTVGELARMFAAERGWPEPLVSAMQGWRRGMWYDETVLPWVQPSPNLPTLDSVTLYPGTCLLEGTNLSEGRGTTRPFEVVGAPWLDPYDLADALNAASLPGVAFRPLYFAPTSSKHAGELCGGVQAHIVDRNALPAVEVGLRLLVAMRDQAPEQFSWLEHDGSYFIDKLLGSNRPRQMLDEGAAVEDVMQGWDDELGAFRERRRPYLLYE